MGNQTTELKEMLDALNDWKSEKEIEFAGSYGRGKHKSLKLTLNGGYKGYNNGACVLETIQPFQAVEKYIDL